jgi:ribosomal protein S18 acetylase RimI-like enzyme
MIQDIQYRKANFSDTIKLSILFKQVYISTYGVKGVSDEFANFITKQFSVERLESIILGDPGSLIVAEHQGNLVGVVEIQFEKESPVNAITAPELNKLYILEWFCGKGIGQGLMAEAEKVALSRGATQMWLWVLESNVRAIRFYEKQRYEIIGHAPFQMEVNSYHNKVMLKSF